MEIKYYSKEISTKKFIEDYIDLSFIEYCKECVNYGTNWACPPNDLDSVEFVSRYDSICIYGQKIIFYEDELEYSRGKDLSKLFKQWIYPIKTQYFIELLDIEEEGQYLMSSGYCNLCEKCQRIDNKPCIKPNMLRLSMDCFGVNITKIAEVEFDTKMAWNTDRFPDYYFLISGILK